MADLPTSPEKDYPGSTLPDDRKTLLEQLEAAKGIQKRWPGAKVFLDAEYGANPEKADFQR
jgi:hypothetical protein